MIEPYYQDTHATLYCGDCLDVMRSIDLDSVDAVVTDPPYGISLPCNYYSQGMSEFATCNDYPDVIGDDKPYNPNPILDLGKSTVLWGANNYASRLPDSGGWLVWDKLRPDEWDQSTCELAWTNCVKGVRRFVHLWHGCMRDSEPREHYHPTQKPVALFAWCLSLRWTKDWNVILDPYMGSGPCGVAAKRNGIKYIGIELSEEYCEIAANRLRAESRLF